MPLIQIHTSSTATHDAKSRLLSSVSRILASELGKPEGYVMAYIRDDCQMLFGASADPSCYVEVKNIGKFKPEQTRKLSQKLCESLSSGLGVSTSRMYIEFSDATGYLWGYDSATFA